MAEQEQEISSAVKVCSELSLKNVALYKDYGDRLMFIGERLRLQLSVPGQEGKELFSLLLQLSQFFEIIGRLYSQDFSDVQADIQSEAEAISAILKNTRETAYQAELLKVLPKAMSSHAQLEKLKQEYERASKETQEQIVRVKSAKQDSTLQYNISLQQNLEEKA